MSSDEIITIFKQIYEKYNVLDNWDHDYENIFKPIITSLTTPPVYSDTLRRPVFMLMYGPQGSGKTTVSKKVVESLGLQMHDFIRLVIDELVYQSKEFKDEIDKIFESDEGKKYILLINNLINNLDVKEAINNLNNNETKKYINTLYFSARKYMNEINDKLLEYAFNKNINIIFETVGNNWGTWHSNLLRSFNKNYETRLVFPYVEMMTLKIRYLNRAIVEKYSLNIYEDNIINDIWNNLLIIVVALKKLFVVDNNTFINNIIQSYIYIQKIEYDPDLDVTSTKYLWKPKQFDHISSGIIRTIIKKNDTANNNRIKTLNMMNIVTNV